MKQANSKIKTFLLIFMTFFLCGFSIFSDIESGSTVRGNNYFFDFLKIKIYLEQTEKETNTSIQELVDLIEPFATFVNKPIDADVALKYSNENKKIHTTFKNTHLELYKQSYDYPKEKDQLYQTLLGYAFYSNVAHMENKEDFADVKFEIDVYMPTDSEGQNIINVNGVNLKQVSTLSVEDDASYNYVDDIVVSFSVENLSHENYYVYILNYTEKGQVIPVVAPNIEAKYEGLVAYKEKRDFSSIYLNLSANIETIKFIITRYAVDLSQWSQDNIHDNVFKITSDKIKKLNDNNWSSIEVKFVRKEKGK